MAVISTIVVDAAADTKDLTDIERLKQDLGIASADTSQDDLLEALITEASHAIGAYCARPEGFGTENVTETFRILYCAPARLLLGRDLAPVIGEITEDGTVLAEDEWVLDGAMLLRLVDDVPTCWPATKVVISYAAGYELPAGLPQDIQRAAIDLCTTYYSARGRDRLLRSESVDGVASASYLDPRSDAGGLPPSIAAMLAPHRRLAV